MDRKELREKIARRAKALTEEGCWIDKDALEQVFICPNMDCFECFSQHGVIALLTDIEEAIAAKSIIFAQASEKAALDLKERWQEEAKREIIEEIDPYIKQVVDCDKHDKGYSLVDPVGLAALDYWWKAIKETNGR